MTKELLTIEFRYYDEPKYEYDSGYESKKITIGVFDTFDKALIEGNKVLEIFEKYFKINSNWKIKDRFSKKGGCFGFPKRLISNLGYLKCGFDFYAKIETLKYDDVEQTILDILEYGKRYKNLQQEN